MTYKKKRSKKIKGRSKSYYLIFFILLVISCVTFYFKIFLPRRNNQEIEYFSKNIPKGYHSLGIDISHHQGKINWEKLFTHYRLDTVVNFVYCKATEGKDIIDSEWENNRSELLRLEITNGAYHFFTFRSTPEEQAQNFLTYYKPLPNDLPPVLDIELEDSTDQSLKSKIKVWLDIIENETGKRPIIYTSLHFFETKFQNDFKNYKFWIAAYRDSLEIKDDRIIHWQFNDRGILPGIKGYIDVNASLLFKKESIDYKLF